MEPSESCSVLGTRRFELVMAVIILFNLVVACVDVDRTSACSQHHDSSCEDAGWLYWSNGVLLVIYSFEICCRLFVHQRKFFGEAWRVFDFCIVFFSIVFELVKVAIVEDVGDMP
eukprot:TRINITY_DN17883_c0_g1_i1.p1 TRINITY_DN17883_c0_g1~~TRINITY_DN17883_c0_g1_i1.p1  ORF type:complete len:115 (-),score=11.55 TRINITY_DN17883_c0_g1_i1:123-467(-)